ncbi:MAG: DUF2357 domain-containing protein [Sphingobacteriaceae bacterium]|nr:DUF2357 domain-containing protein [Sphingobacteriaceae bacterium]
MEVLRFQHPAFKLTVETRQLEIAFAKAEKRIHQIDTATAYAFTTGCELSLWHPNTNEAVNYEAHTMAHPIFFENKLYHFNIEFHEDVTDARVLTRIKEWEEAFLLKKIGNVFVLMGSLNFGNEIGKHQLKIVYNTATGSKETSLGFEVFPIKLDYKTDYRNILQEIEEAYPNLVLDFLKKTYQNFKSSSQGQNNDIIWWAIFSEVFRGLVEDLEYVVRNPHRRLQEESYWVRPEKIRQASPQLAEQYHRHRHIPNKRYLIKEKVLRTDTFENRFVKAALLEVQQKFHLIKKYIETKYSNKLTAAYQFEMNAMGEKLSQLANHRFFKEIGAFEGFRQESLVLQRKHGYAGILRNWLLLRSGYSFFEGANKLELKDIAELYEIWCFLEMKGVLEELLQEKPNELELAEIRVSKFNVEIKEGRKSRVSFSLPSGELVELFHELQYLNDFDKKYQTGSYTSHQKPDIVLRIHKKDLLDDQVFTFLFDAKYRLASDEKEGMPDAPPEDAINQMHRYRDAIYYEEKGGQYRSKEVIGGYILYPGRDEANAIKENSHYFNTIKKVNIGAIPVLPGYDGGKHLLEEHIKNILEANSETLLQNTPPQRGKMYQNDDAGLVIGMIAGERMSAYKKHLEEDDNPSILFHSKPSLVFEGMVNYFAPYFKGQGVSSYYRINKFQSIARKLVFKKGHPLYLDDDKEIFVLELSRVGVWKHPLHLEDGHIRTFRYARLKSIKSPENNKIKTILKDSLKE